jgi:arginyl-tRNA synthetase
LLLEYENVLLETASKNMPHILCKYCYDLTKTFSSFYNNIRVLDEKDMGKKVLRIQLIDLYANILEDAFNCL